MIVLIDGRGVQWDFIEQGDHVQREISWCQNVSLLKIPSDGKQIYEGILMAYPTHKTIMKEQTRTMKSSGHPKQARMADTAGYGTLSKVLFRSKKIIIAGCCCLWHFSWNWWHKRSYWLCIKMVKIHTWAQGGHLQEWGGDWVGYGQRFLLQYSGVRCHNSCCSPLDLHSYRWWW